MGIADDRLSAECSAEFEHPGGCQSDSCGNAETDRSSRPGSTASAGTQTAAGTLPSLKDGDAAAIPANVRGVNAISPVVMGSAQLIAGAHNWQTRVQAVRPAYQQIQDWHVSAGAFFTPQDDASANNVVVLGQTVAHNLFPDGRSPVGQVIRIRNVPFSVVGVLAPKGGGFGGDQDDVVLLPLQTGQVRLFGTGSVSQIMFQVDDAVPMKTAITQLDQLLRQQHQLGPALADDFAIFNNNDIIQRVQGVSQAMTVLLGSIGAVSLIVGGIGIMNLMLVSVTERTREIGIRLAIGAQPADLLAQFLVEAVELSVLGGVIGILLGSSMAFGVSFFAGWAAPPLWGPISLAFGFSALANPARKASLLDPIVALRYE